MRKLAIKRCILYALFMSFPGIFKVIFAKPITAIIRLTLPVPLKHAYCSNFSHPQTVEVSGREFEEMLKLCFVP